MTNTRGFIFNIAIPITAIAVVAGLIFGSQALSGNSTDGDIQQALAKTLDTSGEIELKFLQEVKYGYGVCGLYKPALSEQGYASFFYDKVNDNVILDVDSQQYTTNCGLSSFCY